MKKISLSLLALAAALALVPVASADPITGAVAIGGFSDSWDATSITFTAAGFVGAGTGTFASLVGDTAALSNFTFVPATDADGVVLFNVSSGTAEFIIQGVTVVSDTATFLNLTGYGTLEETGYDNTLATFTLTSTANGLTGFTIDSTVTPEPGSLFLLGTGLLGLGLLARQKLTN